MQQIHFSALPLGLALAALFSSAAFCQQFPVKPLRIVTGGVGGGSDFTSRFLAQGISGPLGQPVVVDNRASGVTPGLIVAKAAPDGHTLMVAAGTFTIGPLMQETPYDPVKDFAPISLTNIQPNVLVVHQSVPVKSVKELIALAKAKPGTLNYSTGQTGSSSHLAPELFKYMARIDMVRVPFSTGSSRMAALVGGEVQLEFATPGAVAPHIKQGRLRALAVTSAQPTNLMPGIPTVTSSGLPGYEFVGMTGIFAPARTPGAIIKRLNQEIVKVVNSPDIKQKFFDSGVETVGSSPEEYAAKIKAERERLGKVIKAAGIKTE